MGHKQLTQTQREILARLKAQNVSVRKIAGILGYAPSSISRELRRNREKNGTYQADKAQRRAEWRIRKDKKASKRTPELIAYIQNRLREFWSPEQIEGRLKLMEAERFQLSSVCFKTIYRWIQKDAQSSKKRPFQGYGKYFRLKKQGKVLRRQLQSTVCYLPSLPSIEERPCTVAEYGHWECDLIHGHKRSGYILTAVERKSGFLMARFCSTRSMECVSACLKELFRNVPRAYRRTLTYDRGKEFFGFREVEADLQVKSYFCHPGCPGERALNEQSNGLLRQFFPRRMDFSRLTNERIAGAVALINHRPRKKFGYRSTVEFLREDGNLFLLQFI